MKSASVSLEDDGDVLSTGLDGPVTFSVDDDDSKRNLFQLNRFYSQEERIHRIEWWEKFVLVICVWWKGWNDWNLKHRQGPLFQCLENLIKRWTNR